MVGLGVVLHYDLGRYEEAEEAYRKAIALNEKLWSLGSSSEFVQLPY